MNFPSLRLRSILKNFHKTGKVWTRDAALKKQRHLPRNCWAILPNFTWIVIEKTIWPSFDSLLPSPRKTSNLQLRVAVFSTSWGGFSFDALTIYIPHASARGSSSKAPPWWTSQQAMLFQISTVRRVRGCTYVYSDKYSMYYISCMVRYRLLWVVSAKNTKNNN